MVSVRLPASQLRRLERALKRRRRLGTDDGAVMTRSRILRVVISHGLDYLECEPASSPAVADTCPDSSKKGGA